MLLSVVKLDCGSHFEQKKESYFAGISPCVCVREWVWMCVCVCVCVCVCGVHVLMRSACNSLLAKWIIFLFYFFFLC